jgi:ribulose-5-phosphate 4-epimerase/fuculose-1-phosphate aldolase
MRKIHIIGGGTVAHVRPHLALCAPAYGKVVRQLFDAIACSMDASEYLVHLYTTKMAGNRHQIWTARSGIEDEVYPPNLETNEDIAALLDHICVMQPEPSIVFLPAALCDFDVRHIEKTWYDERFGVKHKDEWPGKDKPRLLSSDFVPLKPDNDPTLRLALVPGEKVIQRVRRQRKDIFLVGFKTTTGAEKQAQFDAGLTLLKQSSCNLVLANDLVTKLNMVITPEQAPHYVSTDRRHVLRQLVGMALARSKGRFTHSEVVEGKSIGWNGEIVPDSLRTVVNHCLKRGAYKPFLGKTVGHFAFKVPVAPGVAPLFITSKRGVNFNELEKVGMVSVQTDGDNKVIAMGAKPSVGGQSQRIIFAEHPDVDCIVHFHCPLKPGVPVADRELNQLGFPLRSQAPYECGSHECGKNTSDGLELFVVDKEGHQLKAVMLDKHGPNIVFNKNIDPQTVIDFIERYWDLERSTSEVP